MSIKSSIYKELYPDFKNIDPSETFANYSFRELRSIPKELYSMERVKIVDLSHNEIISLCHSLGNLKFVNTISSSQESRLSQFSSSLHFFQSSHNALSPKSQDSPSLKTKTSLNDSLNQSSNYPQSPFQQNYLNNGNSHEQNDNIENIQNIDKTKINSTNQWTQIKESDDMSSDFSQSRNNSKTEDFTILNLPEVEKLFLQDNAITSLEGLQMLPKLQILNANNNTINIVNGLNMCINLRILDLSENQIFQIEPPNSFKNLLNLEYLDISSNMLKNLPNLIWNRNLIYLNISNNFFTDSIWDEIETSLPMETIRELDIHNNELSAITPFLKLRKFINLHTLNILENPLWENAKSNNIDLLPYFLFLLPHLTLFIIENVEEFEEDMIRDMIIKTHLNKEQFLPLLNQTGIEQLIHQGSENEILNLLKNFQKKDLSIHNNLPLNNIIPKSSTNSQVNTLDFQNNFKNNQKPLSGNNQNSKLESSHLIENLNQSASSKSFHTMKRPSRLLLPDVESALNFYLGDEYDTSNDLHSFGNMIDNSNAKNASIIHSPNVSRINPTENILESQLINSKNLFLPSPGGLDSPKPFSKTNTKSHNNIFNNSYSSNNSNNYLKSNPIFLERAHSSKLKSSGVVRSNNIQQKLRDTNNRNESYHSMYNIQSFQTSQTLNSPFDTEAFPVHDVSNKLSNDLQSEKSISESSHAINQLDKLNHSTIHNSSSLKDYSPLNSKFTKIFERDNNENKGDKLQISKTNTYIQNNKQSLLSILNEQQNNEQLNKTNNVQLNDSQLSTIIQSHSNNSAYQRQKLPEWKIEINRLQRQIHELREQCKYLTTSHFEQQSKAASTIQRNIRRFLVLKKYGPEIDAIRQRLKMKKNICLKKKYTSWRNLHSVPKSCSFKKDRNNLSAVKIQAIWRGYASRKKIQQYFKYESSALTIQRFWRQYKSKNDKFYRLQLEFEKERILREKLQEALKYLWIEVSYLRKWKETYTQ